MGLLQKQSNRKSPIGNFELACCRPECVFDKALQDRDSQRDQRQGGHARPPLCPIPNILVASCGELQNGFAFSPQDVQVRVSSQYSLYVFTQIFFRF
jgi:hypothetical protein